jgi:hypothetical protein
MAVADPSIVEKIASGPSGDEARMGAGDQAIGENPKDILENVADKDADPAAPPREYMTGWRLYALTFA